MISEFIKNKRLSEMDFALLLIDMLKHLSDIHPSFFIESGIESDVQNIIEKTKERMVKLNISLYRKGKRKLSNVKVGNTRTTEYEYAKRLMISVADELGICNGNIRKEVLSFGEMDDGHIAFYNSNGLFRFKQFISNLIDHYFYYDCDKIVFDAICYYIHNIKVHHDVSKGIWKKIREELVRTIALDVLQKHGYFLNKFFKL